uniref:Uncharacterized protein n=1 Tax=Rhizophora mucronata TaxID=61149 RepID=A0A2P2NDE6_RHIMU
MGKSGSIVKKNWGYEVKPR